MPDFMFIYHGGKTPETQEEIDRAMNAWGGWMQTNGPSFVDAGNPVGKSYTVTSAGVADDGGPNPVTGYTIVRADTLEEACRIASSNPIVLDGGSIEVAQVNPIEM